MEVIETPEEALLGYLKLATSHPPPFAPLERFILDKGKPFEGVKRPRGIRKQQNRQCFKNATLLSLRYPHLHYVEGFAIHNGLFPMFHAWCTNSEGEAIDPTWRWPERSVYRGFVIPRNILLDEIKKRDVYGVLDFGLVNIKVIEYFRSEAKPGS